MKTHLIVAAAATLLLAGCNQGSNSGGTAEESTGQGLNAQTQQSGTIQQGTTSNAPAGTSGSRGAASTPSGQSGSSGNQTGPSGSQQK